MLVNQIHSLSIFDLKLYQIYVAAFSIGMGPVPWVIMSEVSVIWQSTLEWFCGFLVQLLRTIIVFMEDIEKNPSHTSKRDEEV